MVLAQWCNETSIAILAYVSPQSDGVSGTGWRWYVGRYLARTLKLGNCLQFFLVQMGGDTEGSRPYRWTWPAVRTPYRGSKEVAVDTTGCSGHFSFPFSFFFPSKIQTRQNRASLGKGTRVWLLWCGCSRAAVNTQAGSRHTPHTRDSPTILHFPFPFDRTCPIGMVVFFF